ncbi:MAG: BatD family protein, partial [Verrucomicrobiota bacterium]
MDNGRKQSEINGGPKGFPFAARQDLPSAKCYFRLRGRGVISFCFAVLLCLGALGSSTAMARAANFTASLDRDTIALGESATLSLTFEGGQSKNVPTPSVPGLQISQIGTSQSVNIVNGAMSSTVTVTFSVTPQHDGKFIFPAMTADVNGQSLTSQPLELTVQKGAVPSAAAVNTGSEVAFMKLLLPQTNVYVGQVLAAQLQIYLRDDVQNLVSFQFTAEPAEGFVLGKSAQGGQYRKQIGNRVYAVVPLSIALTVLKSGDLNLGPFTAQMILVLPSSQPQDRFSRQFGFRSFFNEEKQISLTTDSIEVQSLPLPTEGKPADFNGVVGHYTMTVSAGPTNVAVGDPITVRIQISGRGALDSLTLPNQPEWRDFKVYPPASKVETSDQLGLEGAKMFEEIVTPQNTDVHQLPQFSFSFFDPDDGNYHTLTQPSVQLAVRSAGMAAVPTIAAAKSAGAENPSSPQDILPIKDEFGALVPATPPLVTRPAFLALQGVPVLAWLAAFVWRKRTDSLANNPRLRRRRQVAQLVRDGLDDLHRLAAENKSDEFFATLFRLLQEQLGERLDCPASSITESVVDERVASHGVPEATLQGLRELFHLCNQARYAPVRGSGELNSVVAQFENVTD